MSPNVTGQLLEFHNTGKIRILAVNSQTRLKAAPDIPTAIEQGVPNMIGQLFLGIYAPAKTPAPVVERLTDASRKALAEPQFEKVLTDSGFETVSYFGDSALRYMAEELARWKPVIDAIGLKTL